MFVHVGKDIVVDGIGQFYILRYVGNLLLDSVKNYPPSPPTFPEPFPVSD